MLYGSLFFSVKESEVHFLKSEGSGIFREWLLDLNVSCSNLDQDMDIYENESLKFYDDLFKLHTCLESIPFNAM